MFKYHFKLAWRNLIKNKGYSLINIGGLTIGITAFLIIMQYVNFESGYDSYHPRINDLYRVTLTWNLGNKGFNTLATNHPPVAYAMKEDFPEVENFARVANYTVWGGWGSFVLSYTNENGAIIKSNVNEDVYFADSTTLELFDIPLIKGNPKTALSEPRTIILSSEVAKRFFGDQDPINKNLIIGRKIPMKVTGVFDKLPENTHLKFNMLISFATISRRTEGKWTWPEFYNYVRLKPGTDPALVEAKFPDFAKKYLSEIMQEHGFEAKFGLQPVRDIHLKSHLINELDVNANEKTLNFLRIIAAFVILIALMNFINLSTAKSTERAMEVGLKKVAGIKKEALIGQFLFESLTINLISAILAVILINVLSQPFNLLVGIEILSMDIWLHSNIWIQLLILILLGGILAGLYPAFVLSGFKPIQVLKGKLHQSGKGAWMRKILVVAQFTICIALISGTYIMYSQFSYMQNKELGFDADHNLIVRAPTIATKRSDKIEVFKNELLNNPKINAVTLTNEVPGKKIRNYNTARQIHERKEDGVLCHYVSIDHNFLETYKIKLVAGRNFRQEERVSTYRSKKPVEDHKKRVMVNEAATRVLGFPTPEDAVGKKIIILGAGWGRGETTAEIIGVTENYHQQSPQLKYDPIIYFYHDSWWATYFTINMNTLDVQTTIEDVGEKFEELFPKNPYNYFFLNDHFNIQYKADLRSGRIFLLFAGLAIFIATLGLFGLGSYMTLKRTKELCIRKVLGANIFQVLVLIPKSLLLLVLISGLIAIPITYFLVSEWLLNYAFRVDLNFWMFLAPLLLVVVVAAISVLPESIKVALLKPANYLRNE